MCGSEEEEEEWRGQERKRRMEEGDLEMPFVERVGSMEEDRHTDNQFQNEVIKGMINNIKNKSSHEYNKLNHQYRSGNNNKFAANLDVPDNEEEHVYMNLINTNSALNGNVIEGEGKYGDEVSGDVNEVDEMSEELLHGNKIKNWGENDESYEYKNLVYNNSTEEDEMEEIPLYIEEKEEIEDCPVTNASDCEDEEKQQLYVGEGGPKNMKGETAEIANYNTEMDECKAEMFIDEIKDGMDVRSGGETQQLYINKGAKDEAEPEGNENEIDISSDDSENERCFTVEEMGRSAGEEEMQRDFDVEEKMDRDIDEVPHLYMNPMYNAHLGVRETRISVDEEGSVHGDHRPLLEDPQDLVTAEQGTRLDDASAVPSGPGAGLQKRCLRGGSHAATGPSEGGLPRVAFRGGHQCEGIQDGGGPSDGGLPSEAPRGGHRSEGIQDGGGPRDGDFPDEGLPSVALQGAQSSGGPPDGDPPFTVVTIETEEESSLDKSDSLPEDYQDKQTLLREVENTSWTWRSALRFTLEVFLPFLMAGVGMCMAGYVLNLSQVPQITYTYL